MNFDVITNTTSKIGSTNEILTNTAIFMIIRNTKITTTNKLIEIYQIQQSGNLKIK